MRRQTHIRQKVKGNPERPRLAVFRSLKHIYAQVIDDENNCVLASAGTWGKANAADVEGLNKSDQAKKDRCQAGRAMQG